MPAVRCWLDRSCAVTQTALPFQERGNDLHEWAGRAVVDTVGTTWNENQLAMGQQTSDLLNPCLRRNSVPGTTHHQCSGLNQRKLFFDSVSESTAKCSDR